jgi:hypothetical protein
MPVADGLELWLDASRLNAARRSPRSPTLEDRAELFGEGNGRLRAPIGPVLTPPGYPRGRTPV